jgi:hypothetical protein
VPPFEKDVGRSRAHFARWWHQPILLAVVAAAGSPSLVQTQERTRRRSSRGVLRADFAAYKYEQARLCGGA